MYSLQILGVTWIVDWKPTSCGALMMFMRFPCSSTSTENLLLRHPQKLTWLTILATALCFLIIELATSTRCTKGSTWSWFAQVSIWINHETLWFVSLPKNCDTLRPCLKCTLVRWDSISLASQPFLGTSGSVWKNQNISCITHKLHSKWCFCIFCRCFPPHHHHQRLPLHIHHACNYYIRTCPRLPWQLEREWQTWPGRTPQVLARQNQKSKACEFIPNDMLKLLRYF